MDIETLEKAQAEYDAALERVKLGEKWLAEHQTTHPKYHEAQVRFAQRQAELEDASFRLEQAARAVEIGAAKDWDRDFIHDERGPASINCQICGQPVHGWPAPRPGHYVHLECL
jgi:hypothetical protein